MEAHSGAPSKPAFMMLGSMHRKSHVTPTCGDENMEMIQTSKNGSSKRFSEMVG
jgi:hypothetical protein